MLDAKKTINNFFDGYATTAGDMELLLQITDWPHLAQAELERRAARFIESLPSECLEAVASGEVNLCDVIARVNKKPPY